MHPAVEVVRAAFNNDQFVVHVSETNDQSDFNHDEIIDSAAADDNEPVATGHDDSMHVKCFDHDGEPISHDAAPPNVISDAGTDAVNTTASSAGDQVEMFWLFDDHYYPGTVSGIDENVQQVIAIDDSDAETLDMTSETWRSCATITVTSSAAFSPLFLTLFLLFVKYLTPLDVNRFCDTTLKHSHSTSYLSHI